MHLNKLKSFILIIIVEKYFKKLPIASLKIVQEGSKLDNCKGNLDTGQLAIFVELHRFIDFK